jgi:hypothetical protein
VKTTPKPRATKKSSGELVGPLLFPPFEAGEVAAAVESVWVADMIAVVNPTVPYV